MAKNKKKKDKKKKKVTFLADCNPQSDTSSYAHSRYEPQAKTTYKYRLYSENNVLVEQGEVEYDPPVYSLFLGVKTQKESDLRNEILKLLNYNTGKTFVFNEQANQFRTIKTDATIYITQLLCNKKGDFNYWDNENTEKFILVFSNKPHIRPTAKGKEIDMNKVPQTKGHVDQYLEINKHKDNE